MEKQSFEFIFGGYQQRESDPTCVNGKSCVISDPICDDDLRPPRTYYANASIFSSYSPRKMPRGVGKLCKKVFEDE